VAAGSMVRVPASVSFVLLAANFSPVIVKVAMPQGKMVTLYASP
jgi:hypothetical protein